MALPDGFDEAFFKEVAVYRRQSFFTLLGVAGRIVLEASADLAETLGHGLGRQKLVAFLNGTDSNFIRANELDRLAHYGVFESFRRTWVERLVETLLASGYLLTEAGIRPVLGLSEEADELLRIPEELPLLPQDLLDDAVLGPSCPRNDLEVRIRHVRARLAQRLRRAPRQVMTDTVVRDLALGPARTREEIEACLPAPVKPYAGTIWHAIRGSEDVNQTAGREA
jgi:superfamily II DNA helicase RecQ